ncbi:MAG TPA: glutamate--tRNA ligase, partial [Candidatus Saccharimonadales bacterium]|nr:glutamate--tRNA ligase [Candidatus Saccharimonadales bacterium]
MTVRTRMAPSPTGEYHIGSMRTMLFNFAWAKKNNGQFVLRIEDTDRTRLVEGSLERTLQVVKDFGLSWDEGPVVGGPYAPYVQSERLSLYQEYANKLLESGHAYYCFCTPERLTQVREEQQKAGAPLTHYDKFCLKNSKEESEARVKAGEKHVIRYKMPADEEIQFNDLFLGPITFHTKDLDDYVMLKSDGFPTYHLAVVVDDHLMNMTYIMRGVEWIPSTPKHILLYKAFGWEMPLTGHLPNLKEVGAHKKLSKRDGTVDARLFLEEGYLPEALLNFLMLLGWNPGTEKEIYSLEEFISAFSLERVHKTDLISFDREKLLWFNGVYIRQMSVEDLWLQIVKWAATYGVDLGIDDRDHDYIIKVVALTQERLRLFSEFNELTSYFFTEPKVDKELLNK